MVRMLQRARPAGGWVTMLKTLLSFACGKNGGRPGRGASHKPPMPDFMKRCRHNKTVWRLVASAFAAKPSSPVCSRRRMSRALNARDCGVLSAAAKRVSSRRCVWVKTKDAAFRAIRAWEGAQTILSRH